MQAVEVARRLAGYGFFPLPIYGIDSGVQSAGKRPIGDEWQYRQDPFSLPFADSGNIGIRCGDGGLLAIDCDITDPEIALAVRRVVAAKSVFIRFGNRPKFLALARSKDCASHDYKWARGGEKFTVQFLGTGKQFVAYGIHPATRQPYEWPHSSPLETPLFGLPEIDPSELLSEIDFALARLGLARVLTTLPSGQEFTGKLTDKAVADAVALFAQGVAEVAAMIPGTGRGTKVFTLGLQAGVVIRAGHMSEDECVAAVQAAMPDDGNAVREFLRGVYASEGERQKAIAAREVDWSRHSEQLGSGISELPALQPFGEYIASDESKRDTQARKLAKELSAWFARKAGPLCDLRKNSDKSQRERESNVRIWHALIETGAVAASDEFDSLLLAARLDREGLHCSAADRDQAAFVVGLVAAGQTPERAIAVANMAVIEKRRAIASKIKGAEGRPLTHYAGLAPLAEEAPRLGNGLHMDLGFDGSPDRGAAQSIRHLVGPDGDADNDVAFAEGHLWIFRDGVWAKVDEKALNQAVLALSGLDVDGKPFRISSSFANDVCGLIQRNQHQGDSGFFSAARPGIALTDAFLEITARGVNWLPLSRDLRCRHKLAVSRVEVEAAASNYGASRTRAFVRAAWEGEPECDAHERIYWGHAASAIFSLAPKIGNSNRMLYHLGQAGSGKSSRIDLVLACLPAEASTVIHFSKIEDKFTTGMDLPGRSFGYQKEAERKKIPPGDFKSLVSCEALRGAIKGGKEFSFRPTMAIMCAGNEPPRFDGGFDGGLIRRIDTLPYHENAHIEDGDPDFLADLVAAELAVIIARAAEAAFEIATNKWRFPKDCIELGGRNTSEHIAGRTDAVVSFVKEHVREAVAPRDALPSRIAWMAFQQYAALAGFKRQAEDINERAFGRAFTEALRHEGRAFMKGRGAQDDGRTYRGVALVMAGIGDMKDGEGRQFVFSGEDALKAAREAELAALGAGSNVVPISRRVDAPWARGNS